MQKNDGKYNFVFYYFLATQGNYFLCKMLQLFSYFARGMFYIVIRIRNSLLINNSEDERRR